LQSRHFFISALLLTSWFSVNAEPWVKSDDYGLRADIQRLADAGIILAPVTTYPLMWKSFIRDVNSTTQEHLSADLQDALLRVKHRYKSENNQAHSFQFSLSAASETLTTTSFGTNDTQKTQASAAYAYLGENVALKVAANYRKSGKKCFAIDTQQDTDSTSYKTSADIISNEQALNECDDASFDDSYLAYRVGNWVLRAGAIDQFWGPGVDSSLILSSNAKPLPALSITREQSTAFKTPWLSWLGQWNFTAQMAKLESTRVVPNALLWSTRASIRPLKQLEIAASWSAQWGGEGQPSSAGDFFDLVAGGGECIDGTDNCDDELITRLGNQLAGFDIRWSDTLLSHPYAVYLSAIGEDTSGGIKPVDRAYLAGVETTTRVYNQNILFNLEYIDTGVACTSTSTDQNCFYEHSDIYKSGYRYHGRTIGSTYDNDTRSLVFTVLGQLANSDDWQVKVRKVEYNNDNTDLYPDNPDIGHSITKVALNSKQLELRYRKIAFGGRMSLGAFISNNTQSDSAVFAKFEYNL
jgi:hypothetical protein